MWSRATAVIYYTVPPLVAMIGMYLLYRATQLERSAADKAYVAGILLVILAWLFTLARSSCVRSHESRRQDNAHVELAKRVTNLESETKELRQDVHSKIAVKTWLEAMDRMDAHHSTSWVHLKDDTSR